MADATIQVQGKFGVQGDISPGVYVIFIGKHTKTKVGGVYPVGDEVKLTRAIAATPGNWTPQDEFDPAAPTTPINRSDLHESDGIPLP